MEDTENEEKIDSIKKIQKRVMLVIFTLLITASSTLVYGELVGNDTIIELGLLFGIIFSIILAGMYISYREEI